MAEEGRRWTPYAYAMNNPIYFTDPDGMWPNPFSKIESQIRGKIDNFKVSVNKKWESFKKSVSTTSSFLTSVSSGQGGVQFWVTNDTKMDGFVKPTVAKDKSKVVDADASGISTVVTSLGTNNHKRGTSLKERAEGATAVAEKADEVSKTTGGSDKSTMSTATSSEDQTVEIDSKNFEASDALRGNPSQVLTLTRKTAVRKSALDSVKSSHTKDSLKAVKDSKKNNEEYKKTRSW